MAVMAGLLNVRLGKGIGVHARSVVPAAGRRGHRPLRTPAGLSWFLTIVAALAAFSWN